MCLHFDLDSSFRHFETGLLWKNSCLTTFAPKKNLRSCTAKIFWPQLCGYISDGCLRARGSDADDLGVFVVERRTVLQVLLMNLTLIFQRQ